MLGTPYVPQSLLGADRGGVVVSALLLVGAHAMSEPERPAEADARKAEILARAECWHDRGITYYCVAHNQLAIQCANDFREALHQIAAALAERDRRIEEVKEDKNAHQRVCIRVMEERDALAARLREVEGALALALDCDKSDKPGCGCWIPEARAALAARDPEARDHE